MKNKKQKYLSWILLLMILTLIKPIPTKAANATVTFGSEAYQAERNETFPIGIYLEADSRIGEYHVEIKYDNRRLSYVSGGDSEENGIITLEGTGRKESIKYMLKFKSQSGGTAKVAIQSASIQNSDTEHPVEFQITELNQVSVEIEGEDTVGESEPEEEEDSIPEELDTDIPLLGKTQIEEQNYYIVDLKEYQAEEIDWDYQLVDGIYQGTKVTWLADGDKTVKFLYLLDEQEKLSLYAYSEEKDQLYLCNEVISEGEKYYFMSPYVCQKWPSNLTLDLIQQKSIVYAMDLNGKCGFYKMLAGNRLVEWDNQEGEDSLHKQNVTLIIIFTAAVVIMAEGIAVALFLEHHKKKKRRRRGKSEPQDTEVIDLSLSVTHEELQTWYEEEKEGKGNPVIAVQNVTMSFRIATQNVSGIKEYLVQVLKKQISYRELQALEHVSFNVYKGEVVGIIGTNGSGKSTLLKIVSGALKPSSGKVLVDRKKLQLLTLGTGFDMELTAKENVYLNGSVIGYSRQFIDEKYDEIVQFAELEGFMEEKVKNFSTGMVSRLGFAIATAGEAAEILILDEVLSVGDEFFRKKSLKRIKEMIHGGSTVLMVSHSMGTIMENCTKVVWIEKGKLKMVGEPKEVCGAYRKQKE